MVSSLNWRGPLRFRSAFRKLYQPASKASYVRVWLVHSGKGDGRMIRAMFAETAEGGSYRRRGARGKRLTVAKSLSPGLYRSSCSCLPDSFTVNFGRFPELFMQQSAPARIYQLTPRAFWDRVTHTQYDFLQRGIASQPASAYGRNRGAQWNSQRARSSRDLARAGLIDND